MPTSYFAMGTVYTMVTTAANIIVLIAAAPSILFTLLAPFHHSDATVTAQS